MWVKRGKNTFGEIKREEKGLQMGNNSWFLSPVQLVSISEMASLSLPFLKKKKSSTSSLILFSLPIFRSEHIHTYNIRKMHIRVFHTHINIPTFIQTLPLLQQQIFLKFLQKNIQTTKLHISCSLLLLLFFFSHTNTREKQTSLFLHIPYYFLSLGFFDETLIIIQGAATKEDTV